MTSVNAEAVLLRRHHTRVDFRGCGNLTDVAAEHLAQCLQLRSVAAEDPAQTHSVFYVSSISQDTGFSFRDFSSS